MIDLHDPEWLAQANDEMQRKGCPGKDCGSSNVSLRWMFLPTGGLLSGSSMKLSCVHALVFKCDDCGMQARVSEDTDGQ